MNLTQESLKKILDYNPDTGEFVWLVNKKQARKGDRAGTISSNNRGVIRIGGKAYFAHRLAFLWMNGQWPRRYVDHIDMNSLNNSWHNLREATPAQNGQNSPLQCNNSSGFKGVSKYGWAKKWASSIEANGKTYSIGKFSNKTDAAIAYNYYAAHLHGEFANLNRISTESYIHEF